MNPEFTKESIEEMIRRGFESPDLEYKQSFEDTTGAWMELAKDVYGMANYGGGYLVIGVKDGTFNPIGMDLTFNKDSQEWVDRTSKWCTGKVEIAYIEHTMKVNGIERKFPILYVHGSVGTLVIPKADGKYENSNHVETTAFRQGVAYTRNSTGTVMAVGGDYWTIFWSLVQRTAAKTGSGGTPLEVLKALSQKTKPDAVQEVLWFNLFPVVEIPDYVQVAESAFRDPSQIYAKIRAREKDPRRPIDVPAFLLAEGRIYTFSPLDKANPLTQCIGKNEPAIPIAEWLSDSAKQPRLTMLLNFNLKELCWKKGLSYDKKHDRFFRRYFGGPIPPITWKPYKKTSTRQLVNPKLDQAGNLSYYEHFAGRLHFTVLGEGIYLLIEPGRVLTEDGENPLDQNSNVRISTRRNSLYHNNHYLYDLKFWLHLLAGSSEEIHMGEGVGRTIVSVKPMTSTTDFGILNDQHTDIDFLDALKSEPFEYEISYEEPEGDNPLTETSLEE